MARERRILTEYSGSTWGTLDVIVEGTMFDTLNDLDRTYRGGSSFEPGTFRRGKTTRQGMGVGYARYSARLKGVSITMDVAYSCLRCNKIIVGPPRVDGNTYRCHNQGCNALLATKSTPT